MKIFQVESKGEQMRGSALLKECYEFVIVLNITQYLKPYQYYITFPLLTISMPTATYLH